MVWYLQRISLRYVNLRYVINITFLLLNKRRGVKRKNFSLSTEAVQLFQSRICSFLRKAGCAIVIFLYIAVWWNQFKA